MRYFLLLVLLEWSGHPVSGQNRHAQATLRDVTKSKPVIDSQAIADWQEVSDPAISSDGQYFMYSIRNAPPGSSTLVIKPLCNEGKEWRYPDVAPGFFSADGRQAILRYRDSLLFLDLASGAVKYLVGIQSVQVQRGGHWLAYQRKEPGEALVLLDLASGRERRYEAVSAAAFSPDSHYLLLKRVEKEGGRAMVVLIWLTLGIDEEPCRIWPIAGRGAVAGRLGRWQFDKSGRQLVFSVEDSASGRKVKSIWYYREGMGSAELRACPGSFGKDTTINSDASFSADGCWLLFQLLSAPIRPAMSGAAPAKVTVWSYKDLVLQPEQTRRMLGLGLMNADMRPGVSWAMVPSAGGALLRPAHDSVFFRASPPAPHGSFMVVGVGEKEWQPWLPMSSVYLEDLRDRSLHLLQKKGWSNLSSFSYSPGGHWLLYYDMREAAYYSYELHTGRTRNITRGIPTVFRNEYGNAVQKGPAAPVASWLAGDSSVLLYDNYDLWQVDPSGHSKAFNITNGYGRQHQVRLRLLNGPESRHPQEVRSPDDELLLTGFAVRNKYNGFYSQRLGQEGDPKQLYMGPYTFYRVESQKASDYSFDDGMEPLKAERAQAWIVQRQSASEAPNYYWTDDFIHFTALTNITPQQGYNWLRSELVTLKQLDGTLSQGVLYKPDNFDPTKKYPLLFNYYEQLSHRLYEFPPPEFTGNNINIPWFVSRGYLVFTPDIHYQVGSVSGKPVGTWAYNSVVSAAQYLSRLPYVDGRRMGIQGHSFGGGETNYLITHTGIFAAAAEAAGGTDPISSYLTLTPIFAFIEHGDKQRAIESGQGGYGATPWERPELYRANSAVLHADKVTTPLLIMHNEHDNAIPWRQGIELYMALRRLHKPSWLLQYDQGGHSVQGENAVDYTLRLTQFFDHYLKDAPPPIWMTRGVPAITKDIDTGLEPDAPSARP